MKKNIYIQPFPWLCRIQKSLTRGSEECNVSWFTNRGIGKASFTLCFLKVISWSQAEGVSRSLVRLQNEKSCLSRNSKNKLALVCTCFPSVISAQMRASVWRTAKMGVLTGVTPPKAAGIRETVGGEGGRERKPAKSGKSNARSLGE